MATSVDLTGKTFNRLTVIGLSPERDRLGQKQWIVRCSCGESKDFFALGYLLKKGNTKSCGCLRRETAREIGLRSKKTS